MIEPVFFSCLLVVDATPMCIAFHLSLLRGGYSSLKQSLVSPALEDPLRLELEGLSQGEDDMHNWQKRTNADRF